MKLELQSVVVKRANYVGLGTCNCILTLMGLPTDFLVNFLTLISYFDKGL